MLMHGCRYHLQSELSDSTCKLPKPAPQRFEWRHCQLASSGRLSLLVDLCPGDSGTSVPAGVRSTYLENAKGKKSQPAWGNSDLDNTALCSASA